MYISLEGIWRAKLADGTEGEIALPGTLDESRLGHRDSGAKQLHPDQEPGGGAEDFRADAPIATRFTRKHTYEGEAVFCRNVRLSLPEGKRVFLEAERARVLRLLIDGREVPLWKPASISTPYVFEVTGMLDGEHEIALISDNSYPGLPRDAIVYSSAATDETQTNWNGVLGYLRLRTEESVFLSSVAVYPMESDKKIPGRTEDSESGGNAGKRGVPDRLMVRAEISAMEPWSGFLTVESEALAHPAEIWADVPAGESEVVLEGLTLAEEVRLWDEEEGNLYKLRAALMKSAEPPAKAGESPAESAELPAKSREGQAGESGEESADKKTVSFGLRIFGDNGHGRFALNGRTIFLRSEANCAEFPETGHPPMTVEEWEEILKRYRAYGVNCMRFHSHCPPEAAFAAADRLGMLMQPELSHWNPKDAFESEESFCYYRTELETVIRSLANHPSFVMLTLGNELHAGEEGRRRMGELLSSARALDASRLYAWGSNVHYGELGCDQESDFYTSQSCKEVVIRGTSAGMQGYINRRYPGADVNYDREMQRIRQDYQKPVFSFEVGQYEVLPDFGELSMFQGISEPVNLLLIQEKVKKLGLEERWGQYVEASGELALIGYREEVEAALRTRELSGISLLGLQDFPGQGTALVGMMNSHLQPKPYAFAEPERFRAFFRESLPLLLLEKYTFQAGESLKADILVANFGKSDIRGELRYVLKAGEEERSGALGEIVCPAGTHTEAGTLELVLDFVKKPTKFLLTIRAGGVENTYPLWVYPPVNPLCPEGVYETAVFDRKAREVLARGGSVYLSPESDKEHLPRSIQGQFTTDFWSVGTFPSQEGGMGQLIDASHPLFERFPTDTHTDWQWWAMASQRAVILPRPLDCIITEMDSYAYLRPMAQLVEFRCGGGRVLLSSMGLQNLQQYPEARALLDAVYHYLGSGRFQPRQELAPEEAAAMVKC